jgi:hypothetical protein
MTFKALPDFKSCLSGPETTGHCATVLKKSKRFTACVLDQSEKVKKTKSENRCCESFAGLFYNPLA